MKPIRLGANQLHHFYRGGERIARFRGIAVGGRPTRRRTGSARRPSDLRRGAVAGSRCCADGGTLRDAITADPERFPRARHTSPRSGPTRRCSSSSSTRAQRLPVHCHPDRAFAREHLGLATGKTEAWLIVESEDASVHLGFREDVDADVVAGWVERQDRDGDARRAPRAAGRAWRLRLRARRHCRTRSATASSSSSSRSRPISSVLLEWPGSQIDGPRDGHLGLGYDVALGAASTAARWTAGELAHLKAAADDLPEARPGVTTLLPPEADAVLPRRAAPPESVRRARAGVLDPRRRRRPGPARDRARRRGRARTRRHRPGAVRRRRSRADRRDRRAALSTPGPGGVTVAVTEDSTTAGQAPQAPEPRHARPVTASSARSAARGSSSS